MTTEEVNGLFYQIFSTTDERELLNFSLEIEKMALNKEIEKDDAIKLYLAIHTKENELAICQILGMIHLIGQESKMDASLTVGKPPKDKLH